MITTKTKLLAAVVGLCSASQAYSSFEFVLENGDKISLGGYLKADMRYVDGELGYQDYWRGNHPGEVDTSHFGINVRETRFNTKYVHGDVTAFIEMDFYGGDGNEVATNSGNPRLRHAFIKNDRWMAGQYWTTFTPLKAFPDALDFGGPIVAEVFVRQPQVRYSIAGFKLAVENPETWGNGTIGNPSTGAGLIAPFADPDETNPDIIGTYTLSGDWGEVQAGVLFRKLDQGGIDETAFAGNIGGRINLGKDDIRFQVNLGESGRYVGAGMVNDIVVDPKTGKTKVEDTTAFTVAYRHVWSENWRSSAYYGNATTDVTDYDRSHWGVNLIRQLTPALSVGAEVGNYAIDDGGANDIDSSYAQMSVKFGI